MPASTPLTRDILGRYSCNTWEEATVSSENIDVVVIGAGMYGGYVASKIYELSKQRGLGLGGLRVLLLDAGPFMLPEHAENQPSLSLFAPGPRNCGPGSNPGLTNEVWGIGWRSFEDIVGQAYCVGGKGIFWGGWCPRLTESDLAQWPEEVRRYLTEPQGFLPHRPITHTESVTKQRFEKGDMLSGYEALEYEIGVKPSDDFVFDPTEAQLSDNKNIGLNEALFNLSTSLVGKIDPLKAVEVAPIAVQTQSYISGIFSLDKYSSVPAAISAARTDHTNRPPDRFAMVPDAHVVKLECASSDEAGETGTRVISNIVVKNDGELKRLFIAPHCQVVLALGCIESTRLALESFPLKASGLAPRGERMGKNYMIHYREDFEFSVSRAALTAWARETTLRELTTTLHQAALHLQLETANGRIHLQLYAATGNNPEPAMYRMIPDLEAQQALAKNRNPEVVSFVLRGIAEQKGEAALIENDANRNLTGNDPEFGFIDLAGPGDRDIELGHARAWVQFPDNAREAPIWQDMHDAAQSFCTELRKAIGDKGTGFFRKGKQGLGTTYHDSGTLWIGEDPDTSVTDVNAHFHHVSNAYCVDQAVFPAVGSANPVLTGLALARKAAEDIVVKHQSNAPSALLDTAPVDVRTGWLSYPYSGMVALPGLQVLEARPAAGMGLYYRPTAVKNLEVSLEWKAFRGGAEFPNAGVLFRLRDPVGVDFTNEAAVKAYFDDAVEIQIDESGKNYRGSQAQPPAIFGDSRFKTGAVYGVAPARQWAAKALSPEGTDSYWNEYHIKVIEDQVEVRLNGKLVCQATLPPSKVRTGFFGLQFHTGKVQFRHIRIKEDAPQF